jgi:MYXO-CTERM domain-containing protein
VLENATSLGLPLPADSTFLPLASETASDDGGHARAESDALATYGWLQARAAQHVDDGSVTGYRQSRGHVVVAFADELLVTRPAGPGPSSLQAVFDLDGAAFAALTAGGPGEAHASYRVTVQVAETVLEWTGDFADATGSGASAVLEATMSVGGATVPDSLPDALPGAAFVTPPIDFEYGTPFTLSTRMEVTVEGSDDGVSTLASAADLGDGFRWVGLAGLSADASVASESGQDWTLPVAAPASGCSGSEAGTAAGVVGLVAVLVLLRIRRRG